MTQARSSSIGHKEMGSRDPPEGLTSRPRHIHLENSAKCRILNKTLNKILVSVKACTLLMYLRSSHKTGLFHRFRRLRTPRWYQRRDLTSEVRKSLRLSHNLNMARVMQLTRVRPAPSWQIRTPSLWGKLSLHLTITVISTTTIE